MIGMQSEQSFDSGLLVHDGWQTADVDLTLRVHSWPHRRHQPPEQTGSQPVGTRAIGPSGWQPTGVTLKPVFKPISHNPGSVIPVLVTPAYIGHPTTASERPSLK